MKIQLICVLSLLALVGVGGCKCRTEKEKGADLVNQKLDLVEGASDALKDRGNTVGRSAAKGIGDTLKGVGSGVKDVLTPTVSVTVQPALAEEGLSVSRATAKLLGAGGQVDVTLTGKKPFSGGLALRALGADGDELGRVTSFEHRDLVFEQPQTVVFEFSDAVRFSEAKSFELQGLAPKQLTVGEGVASTTVNQLSIQRHEVKFYAVFAKGFSGTLQLRARDASGQEVGRSSSPGELQLPPDSAQFVVFVFDPNTEMSKVQKLELRGLAPTKKPAR